MHNVSVLQMLFGRDELVVFEDLVALTAKVLSWHACLDRHSSLLVVMMRVVRMYCREAERSQILRVSETLSARMKILKVSRRPMLHVIEMILRQRKVSQAVTRLRRVQVLELLVAWALRHAVCLRCVLPLPCLTFLLLFLLFSQHKVDSCLQMLHIIRYIFEWLHVLFGNALLS